VLLRRAVLRDVLLGETPTVLRRERYAIPALLGAAVVVAAEQAGTVSPVFPLLGAALCFGVRMLGVQRGINVPTAPREAATRRWRRS
jgi:uncharacterized membrane protein YeiH